MYMCRVLYRYMLYILKGYLVDIKVVFVINSVFIDWKIVIVVK